MEFIFFLIVLFIFLLLAFFFFLFSQNYKIKPTKVELLRPRDAKYEKMWRSWNPYKEIRPNVIILPKNKKDIINVMMKLKQKKLSFAIRNQGYSFTSPLTPAIIDLSCLKKITLLDNMETIGIHSPVKFQNSSFINEGLSPHRSDFSRVVVEAGCSLGEIYDITLASGKYFPAGSKLEVGISQALSGGIGYSTRKYGLLCENIVEMEVILADGSVVICNEEKHTDLFWALRGCGSSNFGIVYSYTIRLVDTPEKVTIFDYLLPLDKNHIKWITENKTKGTKLTCQMTIKKNGIRLTGQYLGSSKGLIKYLKHFRPIESEIIETDMKTALIYFSKRRPREYVKAKSRFLINPLSSKLIDNFVKYASELKHDFSIGIQQLRGSRIEKTSIPYPNAKYMVTLILRWRPEDDVIYSSDRIDALFQKLLLESSSSSYLGMTDEGLEKWKMAYYGRNGHQERLTEIKKKYDPENFFTHPQGI